MRSYRLTGILLAAVLLAALCGCRAKERTQAETVVCSYWTVSESRAAQMQALAERYNAVHPQTPIELQTTVFRSDQIDDRLWTLLHSGVLERSDTVPDLVDVAYQDMEKYVSPFSCLLYPLDAVRAAAEAAGADTDTFDAFTYRDVCFGVPCGASRMRVAYRAELLAQCKVDPDAMKTWEDVRALGWRYHEASGKYLFSVDMDDYLFFLTLLLQNADGAEVSQTQYEKTLLQIRHMYRSSALTLMPGGRHDSKSFRQAFEQGEIACVLLPESEIAELRAACGADDIKICAIPGRAVSIPVYAATIPTAAENYLLMREFLEFAAAETEMFRFAPDSEALPVQNAEGTGVYLTAYKLELAKLLLRDE